MSEKYMSHDEALDRFVAMGHRMAEIESALEKLAGEKQPVSGGEWELPHDWVSKIQKYVVAAMSQHNEGDGDMRQRVSLYVYEALQQFQLRACPPPAGVPVVDVGLLFRELKEHGWTGRGMEQTNTLRAALHACGCATLPTREEIADALVVTGSTNSAEANLHAADAILELLIGVKTK